MIQKQTDANTKTNTDYAVEFLNVTKAFNHPKSLSRDAFKLLSQKPRDGQIVHYKKRDITFALDHVECAIPMHELTVIMGLSGSGKSTLLRLINGLIKPSLGHVRVLGQNIDTLNDQDLRYFRQHDCSMVFQQFALLPHLTVLDNVAFGLRLRGDKDVYERAAFWCQKVGLKGLEKRHPHALSGGQKQRVGLARAMALEPKILLMDEPFSALDPLIRVEMQALVKELQHEIHQTIIFITHSPTEAKNLGDYLGIMHEGRLLQFDDVNKVFDSPINDTCNKLLHAY